MTAEIPELIRTTDLLDTTRQMKAKDLIHFLAFQKFNNWILKRSSNILILQSGVTKLDLHMKRYSFDMFVTNSIYISYQ